jgi:hypothetical protein
LPLVAQMNGSCRIAENGPKRARPVHEVPGEGDRSGNWGAIVLAVLLVPAGLALLLAVLARIEPALVRPDPAPPEPATGAASQPVAGQPASAGLNVLVKTEK